ILFRNNNEPGLQLGARLRGRGIKGAVVDEIKVFEKELSVVEVMQLAKNPEITPLFQKEAFALTPKEKTILREFYTKAVSLKTRKQHTELAGLRKNYVDSMEKVKEVMVMEETPDPVPS